MRDSRDAGPRTCVRAMFASANHLLSASIYYTANEIKQLFLSYQVQSLLHQALKRSHGASEDIGLSLESRLI